MSVKKNDTVILKLKEQIELKQKALGDVPRRFSPITNCALKFDDKLANLQVLNKELTTFLLIRLSAYMDSAVKLGLEKEFMLSGFAVTDWITDLKGRLAFLSRKEEEMKLLKMENKLEELLSNEKKVELELDDMAKELGL